MLTCHRVAITIFAAALLAAAQNIPSRPDSLVDRLPEAVRADAQALLEQKDAEKRAQLADRLARRNEPPLVDFLLAVLNNDSSAAVRRAIVDRLGRLRDPRVGAALEQRSVADPDAEVALLALERLRVQRAQEFLQLFERRMALARKSGNQDELAMLVADHQRWVTASKGAVVPAFLQKAPPLFTAVPAGRPALRVLVIGDYGMETPDQKKVAAAVRQYHSKRPFDIGVTTGDNFLPNGVLSPTDPRWKGGWEDLYESLDFPIFTTLGNHDWGFADSVAAEMIYSHQSRVWRMPATHYTFVAGPVQFFALATDAISETQLIWLREQLDSSRAPWKIVYAHTPIYSHGVHGDSEKLIRELLPVVRDRADIYLAGHDHDAQHLKPEGKTHFFVVGVSGVSIRPPKFGPRSLFADAFFGFAVMEADQARLKIDFLDSDLKVAYTYTLTRR